MIRILLAEDQGMVRGALAALLRLEKDFDVVAEVACGDTVVKAALVARPDVALLDIELPGQSGLAAADSLHQRLPYCRIIMLTTFARPGYLKRALASGALGFVVKDAPASDLARTIRRVIAGERVVDPELALSALSERENPLTPRERRVLAEAAHGATIRDVARTLALSAGHGTQPPVDGNSKARRTQPDRSRPHR